MRTIVALWLAVLFGVIGVVGAEDAATLVPNRLAVAEIGEWVSFELPDGYIQKHIVVKREGEGPESQVTIRVDNIYKDEVVNSDYKVETAGEPLAELPQPEDPEVTLSCRPEVFTLKGKEYAGVAIDVKRAGEPYQIWYVTADIPVYGLAKRDGFGGSAGFEIADFGSN